MTLDEKRKLMASVDIGEPVASAPKDNRTDTMKIIEAIATGGYDAANSVLVGLPDFIMRNSGTATKKAIEDLRARNKEASQVGEIGGLVGSMFIPGGALVKRLGAAAKYLGAVKTADKLGKAAKYLGATTTTGNIGQKIGQSALRGAAQSAEQVIPRALLSEDVGQSLKDAPMQIALGGAIGGGMGAINPLAGKIMGTKAGKFISEQAGEFIDKARASTVGAMGIDRTALIEALKKSIPGGTRASNRVLSQTEKLFDDITEIGSQPKYNFLKEANRDKRIEAGLRDVGEKYENAINTAMKDKTVASKAYNTIIDDIDELEKVNTVQFSSDDNPYMKVAGVIDNHLRTPNGASSLRNKMTERISSLRKRSVNLTDYQDAELQAYSAGKAALDDVFDEVSEKTGGESLKQIGREYRVLKTAKSGELRNMISDVSKPYFGSSTAEKLKIGALFGGGSIASDMQQGKDVDIGNTLLSTLGGSLGTMAYSKILPKLLQRGVASGLKPAEKLVEKLDNLGGVISGKNLPKAGAMLAQHEAQNKNPEATVTEKEESLPPEQKQEARAQFSQKFAGVMNDRLQKIYNDYYSDRDPKEFYEIVASRTGNFSDIKEMSKFLYPEQKSRDNFLRKYDAYLALKDVDIDKAIKGGEGILGTFIGEDKTAKDQQELLRNKLIEMQSEGDMGKRETIKKQVDKYLADVKKGDVPIEQLMKETGLDFNDLSELGLTGA
jgi:uncharacterized protein YoxC